MPYSLVCRSFQSILMPFDFEMAMCSGSVTLVMSVLQALHVAHAGEAAHGAHQLLQVLFIAHVHGHLHQRASHLRLGFGFQAANVRVLIGEHGRDLVQHAGTVVCVDHNLHGEGVRGAAGPFHFDFALHVVHQVLHVAAYLGMHGHSLAAFDIADDSFAPN